MTDLPIPFSGPMVRALLDGSKTQTRRILKDQNPVFRTICDHGCEERLTRMCISNACNRRRVTSAPVRYAVGDRLYVREHWRVAKTFNTIKPRYLLSNTPLHFVADGLTQSGPDHLIAATGKFRQGMHMPRWASRITVIVTDVRVERLQETSEEDAIAEGITCANVIVGAHCAGGMHTEVTADRYFYPGCPDEGYETAVDAYRSLWGHINGEGAWEKNPWVAAYTFNVIKGNIDHIGDPQ